MEDWDELLEFLKDGRMEVRKIAAQNVRSYTQSAPHLEYIETKKPEGVKYLCNLLGDEPSIAGDAAQSLINMTARSSLVSLMLQYNAIGRTMDTLGDKADPLVELKLILLSNLTGSDEEAVKQLLQVDDEDLKGVHVACLLGWFLHTFHQLAKDKGAIQHTHWVLPIMANVSGNSEGQEILLDESPLLHTLPELLRCQDVIVRGGATRLLKNLAMEFSHHPRLVENDLPLCILERLETAAESNKDIRRQAVEAIVLLSRSEAGVNFFDGCGGKKLIQTALDQEKVGDIRDLLQMVVDGLEDVQDAYVVEEEAPKTTQTTSAPHPEIDAKDPDEKELELPE